ncbi:helix-turn-helix domain-containing protein [Candidatus Saccharibacteria bacterium]|jgi:transcriptional regulator with XRE-family HTH domain|nr:helix-turn-helix domain-containing protein [Candidatus Saccharibacteria bacterium]HPR09886.1 helix-turn-helix transcriptional regulator [Candidatus Saccharibacteria bacterium]
MSDETRTPYHKLGHRLRSLREVHKESPDEVSSAVEIDIELLELIEKGRERPSEDILLLLISHYGLQDDTAEELWDLAGYDKRTDVVDEPGVLPEGRAQAAMMVMLDPRILYSDLAEVSATPKGFILTFSQSVGPNGQPLPIARVGMSREQAKAVMGLLHQTLWNLDNPSLDGRLQSGEQSDSAQ